MVIAFSFIDFLRKPSYGFLESYHIYIRPEHRAGAGKVKRSFAGELSERLAEYAKARGLKLKICLDGKGGRFSKRVLPGLIEKFPGSKGKFHNRGDIPELRMRFTQRGKPPRK